MASPDKPDYQDSVSIAISALTEHFLDKLTQRDAKIRELEAAKWSPQNGMRFTCGCWSRGDIGRGVGDHYECPLHGPVLCEKANVDEPSWGHPHWIPPNRVEPKWVSHRAR